jgi:hypothetical protein
MFMDIKLFQCVVDLKFNSLTFSELAEDEDCAMKLVKSRLDRDTRDELDSGNIKHVFKEHPLENCLISIETSIRVTQ